MSGSSIKQTMRAWLKRRRGQFLRAGLVAALLTAVAAGALYMLPEVVALFAPKLDLSRDLYAVNRPVAFTFLDAQGHEAGHRGAIVGEKLTLDQLPAYLPAAFIAMEDRRFYDHGGFDLRGLVRAAWVNWHAGHVVQGGSTITQQLAKILFLTSDRTYSRKFSEVLDAAAIEKSLSKTQILELYLNRIYLGSGAYGVDGASRVYFGRSARNLTLAQAAMLATLTRAPSAFSPRRDLAAAQARTKDVLTAMIETGAITKKDAKAAEAAPASVIDRTTQDARNYFLDTAADEARRDVTIAGQMPGEDLIVHTTLEPKLQETARAVLAKYLRKDGRRLRVHEGAIVMMKPTGAVSALIGGRDYDESVFNRATQARRQPGSAFKAFVYLAAVENGISPWDTRDDGPVDIDGWSPTNYGGREYGTVTLASALAHSINTVTASIAQEVGIGTVIKAARSAGITSPLAANASLALGTSEVTPLELTSAYATFASGGMKVQPYLVTMVEDERGHVFYTRKDTPMVRAVPDDANRDLTAMLYGVIVSGTGTAARLPDREAAGKTGTTQDYRDAWFVGFTTDYVTGVWVGNDNSKPMKTVTGGLLPAAIWKDVMVVAEKGLPAKPLARSQPQAPVEDEDSPYASSDASPGYRGDDESDDDRRVRADNHRPSFLNWLFGPSHDGEKKEGTQNNDEPPVDDDERANQ